MVAPIDFTKKSIIIITGASQGIGNTIAVNFAKRLTPDSIFLLIARSTEGLEKTKEQILEINENFDVHVSSVNLSKPDLNEYQKLMDNLLTKSDVSNVHYSVFIHNAGVTGSVKKVTNLTDLAVWQEHYDLNLFSVSLLNSVFLTTFRSKVKQLVVVNITSLCGREPFKNLAMYGSGKAARDIFFKVLAIEELDVIVLNYSPGPVNTNMFNDLIKTAESEEVRNEFQACKDTSVLTTEQTVEKFFKVLESGKYDSGDVVDYYDALQVNDPKNESCDV